MRLVPALRRWGEEQLRVEAARSSWLKGNLGYTKRPCIKKQHQRKIHFVIGFVLVRISTAVKRHGDHGNFYKGKQLIEVAAYSSEV